MKPFKNKNGMTLLELLVVMGIIAVLAAISLPSFVFIARGSRLRSAAKTVTDTLSAARGLAIAQRHSYYVEFDTLTTNNRLRIFYMPLDNSGQRIPPANYNDRVTFGDWKKLPEPIVFYDDDIPTTVGLPYNNPPITYAKPDDFIQFDPNGGVHGANPTTFTILDSSTLNMNDKPYTVERMAEAKTCRIYVINVTGRIKATIE